MSTDILEEAERGFDFRHDTGDVRPEMSWVFVAELASGDAKWLARIAAMDDIHHAAPRLAVKGGNVVPDRRAIQTLVFHPRHESCRRIGVPLDITHGSIAWDGEVKSEIEATSPGAEGESKQASSAIACVNASGGR